MDIIGTFNIIQLYIRGYDWTFNIIHNYIHEDMIGYFNIINNYIYVDMIGHFI